VLKSHMGFMSEVELKGCLGVRKRLVVTANVKFRFAVTDMSMTGSNSHKIPNIR
jgi:hypothetical protein